MSRDDSTRALRIALLFAARDRTVAASKLAHATERARTAQDDVQGARADFERARHDQTAPRATADARQFAAERLARAVAVERARASLAERLVRSECCGRDVESARSAFAASDAREQAITRAIERRVALARIARIRREEDADGARR